MRGLELILSLMVGSFRGAVPVLFTLPFFLFRLLLRLSIAGTFLSSLATKVAGLSTRLPLLMVCFVFLPTGLGGGAEAAFSA